MIRPIFAIAILLAACDGDIEIADPPPDAPVIRRANVCMNQGKEDRCAEDRPGNIALCYADGKPGPVPWMGDDSTWPEVGSGCAAPDEQGNVFEKTPAGPTWLWWCCAPMK